ncbi:M23 family metallopeptidase [Yunchengibacter salinarum]|uniref:M23 family metallopeptidase n=1 Tax=Yunchengibacter salinarum TaxID=3133399 RepID=UPI0035B680AC
MKPSPCLFRLFIRRFAGYLVAVSGLMLAGALPGYALDLSGQITQGGMAWGRVAPGSSVTLDGRTVKVGPEGRIVFGFGRDHDGDALLKVTRPDGETITRTLSVASRKFDIERVDGLPPKTVTPPESWRKRRQTEMRRVGEARGHLTDATFWTQGFIKPAEGRFSGFYGSQRILNGKPRSPHFGLDIAAEPGTPVRAPAGGVVRLADPDYLLEGGIVIIDHGFGVTSTLFHMRTVTVKEGQAVSQGDQIGEIGAKGRASGPHVDWRINWRNVRLDPALMLGAQVAESEVRDG